MSNSHRNPKELRSLVETCKTSVEMDDSLLLDESFKNLRNLSLEDKTEVGMLKSRIDDQSRLIMVLKNRGDEYINKNSVLEKLNQTLNEEKEELELKLKALNGKNDLITQRFKTLSDYNEEIIKIKDEYKSKNVLLNKQIEELKRDADGSVEALKFSKLKLELEDKIKLLQMRCDENDQIVQELNLKNEQKLAQLMKDHELNINNLKKEALEKQNQKEKEIADQNLKVKLKENEIISLKSELTQSKSQVTELQGRIGSKIIEHEAKVKEMQSLIDKNKSDFENKSSQFAININQLTKDKLQNASQCKKLNEENQILMNKCSNLELKITELEDKLNESSIVEFSKRYERLKTEFNSYKTYVNILIEKEKEVNAKLRFLVS